MSWGNLKPVSLDSSDIYLVYSHASAWARISQQGGLNTKVAKLLGYLYFYLTFQHSNVAGLVIWILRL